uniref:Uncharacterized protein n=1 Tax=viral metagenome TaxID=1070528 RepID=A0A6C0BK55_9ZZZZ
MSSSSIIIQVSTEQLKALIEQGVRAALQGISEGKMPLSEKAPRAKKEKDLNAPKKEPSDWIHFTSAVRKGLETEMEEGKKPHPKAVTQVASALKTAGLQGKWDSEQSKMVDSASSAQISAAYKAWLADPPAISKMVEQGKDKASKKSPSAPSAVAEPPAKKRGRKAKADMTPEELAEHERKVKEKKAVAAPKPAPEPEAADVMDFEPFDFSVKGLKQPLKLLKNDRGDVLTEDMEWYGHMSVDGKIDTDAEKPEDLDV